MNRTKFWPFGALIILAVAVVAAIVAAMLFKYQRSAKASALPNAARIERVDGQVGINQSSDNSANAQNAQWIQATTNMPVGVGDRIYTKENSKTEIAFSGRNVATVDPNTSLDLLDLSRDRTQVALREGSALFDVGSIPSGGLFEVATPCGAVDLQQPGLYQVAINQDGNATATAFSGAA
ncbi:MAG TPA: FecR domain-containing protein, partial [Pyrinomonadaceae bacterium]|nr:FecR domain-containing protein [Pyrinomonadaceae bacterium]